MEKSNRGHCSRMSTTSLCILYNASWSTVSPSSSWRIQHTHTHSFNGPFSGTTQVSQYQKGKTNLDFTGARDSEWQWHQLGYIQVCTSLQTDNHASTPPLSFYRPDALPAAQPTVLKHWRQRIQQQLEKRAVVCLFVIVIIITNICSGDHLWYCVPSGSLPLYCFSLQLLLFYRG